MKMNLPVFLINDDVFLPSDEERLDLRDDAAKRCFDLVEEFYENKVVLVLSSDPLDEEPPIKSLPRAGVLAQVNMKILMPDNSVRVALEIFDRVRVYSYTKEKDQIEAVISRSPIKDLETAEEEVYRKTLFRTLDKYFKKHPELTHSLRELETIESFEKLTDKSLKYLMLDKERKKDYLYEIDSVKRLHMITEDVHKELKIEALERELNEKVFESIDKTQEEIFIKEKIKILQRKLSDVSSEEQEIASLIKKVKNKNVPKEIEKRIIKEIERLRMIPDISPEKGPLRTYIDWFLELPWSEETKDETSIEKVEALLDETHYGLDQAKERILEYIAVKIYKKTLTSPILCLLGPSGVGKTTLAKSIGEALGRNVTKISLGGVNDEAEIVGHRRTYVGAMPGLIIQGMKKAKSTNPVFIIDEIDKMRKDIKGDPASSLLEVLDKEQNSKFKDHYLEEEYDLSKVMFICTANYLDQIPIELQDRLEIVELSSYSEYEKLDISKKYLIPKELKEHGLENLEFTDEALLLMIRSYTKEAGVRELDRLIASIIRKAIKLKLTEEKELKKIGTKEVRDFLQEEKYFYSKVNKSKDFGIVNGLAYTEYGGDTLLVEGCIFHGKEELKLTGSLGDVLIESGEISLSYVKGMMKELKIPKNFFEDKTIHIHFPEGAIPKDGPSAGVSLVTCILSTVLEKPIDNTIAMTGEVTLRGDILKIGGLREKVQGAKRNNIKTIIIPKDNEADLKRLPDKLKKGLDFKLVDNYDEILNMLFYNE